MARHRLLNENWGFDSNCFVCERRNEGGLRIPFEHDDEAGMVVAEFTLDTTYSGAPTFVHGGLTLAILDEAQSWATIAVGGKFAVTAETTSRFLLPVRVGRAYRVEAGIADQSPEKIRTTAAIIDYKERVCVESEATFVVLTDAQAVDAIGAELTDAEAPYLRDP
jgi:acyl-coenzyme A thioesterase PaaI-like protein